MPKANRTCHCCGKKYYYCTSCPNDRRDPQVYVMWDSERCKEIFSILTNEAVGKLSTLECKKKLIDLNVDENTEFIDNVKIHVQRVFSCENIEDAKKDTVDDSFNEIEDSSQEMKEIQDSTKKESDQNLTEEKVQEKVNVKRAAKTRTRAVSEK